MTKDKWYEKAVQWMDKNKPDDEELKQFRAEAAELLGMKEKTNKPVPKPEKSEVKEVKTKPQENKKKKAAIDRNGSNGNTIPGAPSP